MSTEKNEEIIGELVLSEDADNPIQERKEPMPVIMPQENHYTGMLTLAIEKDLSIEKLERFVALQEKWDAEQARKQLLLAHSKFQSMVPVIKKQARADFGVKEDGTQMATYDYAKLEHITEAIKPYLAPHGLSYSWDCVIENQLIKVTCTMSHIDGASKSSTMLSTPDASGGKPALHQLASARSYLKRYTLLDVTGTTVSGEDDDAKGEIQRVEQAEVDSQVFSDEKLQEMMPGIVERIRDGKEPKLLINWLEKKYDCELTDGQKKAITNAGKA